MAISRNNILYLLSKVVPLLEELGIHWWLGRGVLRNFYLTKEIGDKNSDLDFHIWVKDKPILRERLVPIFSNEGYTIDEQVYKIAFYKPQGNSHDFFVEFMFLFDDPNDPEIVYHSRNNGNKYAPKSCFSGYDVIQVENIRTRIPVKVDEYLLGTYGPNWKNNDLNDKNFQSTPSLFNDLDF